MATANQQTQTEKRTVPASTCNQDSPLEQGIDYLRTCVREHPETSALWCLGIGFVLGWKLKPW